MSDIYGPLSPGAANERFSELKETASFVTAEKHGGVMRVSYRGGLPDAIPDVVLGHTASWSDVRPRGDFTVERYNPIRGAATQRDRELAVTDAVRHIESLGKMALLYGWYGTPIITELSSRIEIANLVVRDEIVASDIENKALLLDHLRAAGCDTARVPTNLVVKGANQLPPFSDIVARLGLPFVAQGRSQGGDGTIIVDSEIAFQATHALRDEIRLEEFVDAPYSSIYCLSLPTADHQTTSVFVDTPSRKPVGVDELGISSVTGAGGDWRLGYDMDMVSVTENISRLAQYLYHRYNFFGHFVVEGFVQKDGDFLFNEINARPGGGSEVCGSNQLRHGLAPFTALHVLAHQGLVAGTPELAATYNTAVAEANTTAGQAGAFYLKVQNDTAAARHPTAAYKGSGRYQLLGDRLQYIDDHASDPLAADFDNDTILVANGPLGPVLPDKQLFTLEGSGRVPIVDSQNQLTERARQLARAANKLFV